MRTTWDRSSEAQKAGAPETHKFGGVCFHHGGGVSPRGIATPGHSTIAKTLPRPVSVLALPVGSGATSQTVLLSTPG